MAIRSTTTVTTPEIPAIIKNTRPSKQDTVIDLLSSISDARDQLRELQRKLGAEFNKGDYDITTVRPSNTRIGTTAEDTFIDTGTGELYVDNTALNQREIEAIVTKLISSSA